MTKIQNIQARKNPGDVVLDTFCGCGPMVNSAGKLGRAPDAAVLAAYGFSAKKDLLKQLLDLNLEVAANIEKGSPVMPPGVPNNYPDPQKLVTEDCIRPAQP